jgi:hypothetical protein
MFGRVNVLGRVLKTLGRAFVQVPMSSGKLSTKTVSDFIIQQGEETQFDQEPIQKKVEMTDPEDIIEEEMEEEAVGDVFTSSHANSELGDPHSPSSPLFYDSTNITLADLSYLSPYLSSSDLSLLLDIIKLNSSRNISIRHSNIVYLLNALDLSKVRDRELQFILRYIGASPLRKVEFLTAQVLFLKYYNHLLARGYFSDFIYLDPSALSEDDRYIASLHPPTTALLSSLPREEYGRVRESMLALRNNPPREKSLLQLLILQSNLLLYTHEYYSAARVFMHFVLEGKDIDTELGRKATNYYWAFRKAGIHDPNLMLRLLERVTFPSDIRDGKLFTRLMTVIWAYGVEYQLADGKVDQDSIKAISEWLDKLCTLINQQQTKQFSLLFNSKQAYTTLQTALSFYPELAPNFKKGSFTDAKVDPSNPFKEYFSTLLPIINESHFVVSFNIKSKMFFRSPNLTMLDHRTSMTMIFAHTIYNSTNKKVEYFIREDIERHNLAKKIENNKIIGFYEVDLLLDSEIALEVDSLLHSYYHPRSNIMKSHDFKDKQLLALGLKEIVRVTSMEWVDNISKHKEELNVQLLRDRIQAAQRKIAKGSATKSSV